MGAALEYRLPEFGQTMFRIGPRLDAGLPGNTLTYVKLLALLAVLLIALARVLPRLTSEPTEEERRGRMRVNVRAPRAKGRLPTFVADARGPKPGARSLIVSEDERTRLDSVPDDKSPIGHAQLMLLLRKVQAMSADELRSLADPAVGYTALGVAPEKHRGRVVRFVGTLARVAKSNIDASAAGVSQLYEGQVIGRHYRVYSFYVIDEPAGFKVGKDVVELVGVFFRHIIYETQEGGCRRTPVLIAKEIRHYKAGGVLEPAPRPAPVPVSRPSRPVRPKGPFLDGLERMILDDVPEQTMKLDPKVLGFMLRKVAVTAPATIEAYADPSITYDSFVDSPTECRGRVVRFIGTLQRLVKSGPKIDAARIDAGLPAVYEGQIRDKNWDLYSFYLTDPPEGFRVGEDVVVLAGAYLTNLVYEMRGGGLKATPLIIARRLELYEPPPTPPPATEAAWARLRAQPALAAALAALVILFGALALALRAKVMARGSAREQAIARKIAELEQDLDV